MQNQTGKWIQLKVQHYYQWNNSRPRKLSSWRGKKTNDKIKQKKTKNLVHICNPPNELGHFRVVDGLVDTLKFFFKEYFPQIVDRFRIYISTCFERSWINTNRPDGYFEWTLLNSFIIVLWRYFFFLFVLLWFYRFKNIEFGWLVAYIENHTRTSFE